MLNQEEKNRYSRHIILDEIGEDGQLVLKNSRVLIIGAGGLGAPLIQYLSAAGVGTIGIVDFDRVEDSNLHRQVLFTTEDVGRYKAEVARERVLAQNPHISVEIYLERFIASDALKIAKGYDLIADGTDNFPTRYLVNDTCVLLGIPNVYGSIYKFEGQVSVFNYRLNDGSFSPNYRDLYPTPPEPGSVPSCGEAGVIGVLPGIIGAIQANEVIKVLLRKDGVLHHKLMHLNTLTMNQMILEYAKNPAVQKVTELIDYERFCGIKSDDIPFITDDEYKELLLELPKLQLIDVRSEQEHKEMNRGGINIPLNEFEDRVMELSHEMVVLYCKSGTRANNAAKILQRLGRNVVVWR